MAIFSLKVTAGQELQISYVGYQTLVMKVQSGKFSLGNIVLTADSQVLDDVVVIGYGTQKKGDVTSACGIGEGRRLHSGRHRRCFRTREG